MKVQVDESCIACGLCPQICPRVFQMSEEGNIAVVLTDSVPPEAEESCREAAGSCPVDAIKICE